MRNKEGLDSEAIIQEIIDNDYSIVQASPVKRKDAKRKVNIAPPIIIEKEVPLLTKKERDEMGSIQDHYESASELDEPFVLTPFKAVKIKETKNLVPATRAIQHISPAGPLVPNSKVK